MARAHAEVTRVRAHERGEFSHALADLEFGAAGPHPTGMLDENRLVDISLDETADSSGGGAGHDGLEHASAGRADTDSAQIAPLQVIPASPDGSTSSDEVLDAYSRAVVGAVEHVGPAVVSIYVGGAGEAARARGGAGSGVVVTPDGYLLTNEHVVQRVEEASVAFVDGRSVPAVVMGRDPATDLAVLRAQAAALPYATLASAQP